MAIVFAVRGDSLTARYSTGYPESVSSVPSVITVTADAGVLGGSRIDMTNTGAFKCLTWDGAKNSGESRAFSILMRFKAAYTGTPAAARAYTSLGVGRVQTGPFLDFWHAQTTGNFMVYGKNEANQIVFNSASFGAVSPTLDDQHDLVFTWDGTTAADAANLYFDATLVGSATAGFDLNASWSSKYFGVIAVGAGLFGASNSSFSLVEYVIWDSVIDPTSVALTTGLGSLDGEARTAFVDVAAINGSDYTDPGVANVKLNETYTFAGVELTGEYAASGGSGGGGTAFLGKKRISSSRIG